MIENVPGLIPIIDENGEQINVQVLFGFDLDETKKSYIVYTMDNNYNDEDIEVIISEYNPVTYEIKDIPVDEKNMVLKYYEEVKRELASDEEFSQE